MKEFKHSMHEILGLKGMIESTLFKPFFLSYSFPEGINETHFKTLVTLRFLGPSPMSEISKYLGMEKGSFTPVADKLIKKGYINKNRSEKDRRVYNLELSREGAILVEYFLSEHHKYIENMLNKITTEEQTEFLKAITVVKETLLKLK